jgi:hypothetical protein
MPTCLEGVDGFLEMGRLGLETISEALSHLAILARGLHFPGDRPGGVKVSVRPLEAAAHIHVGMQEPAKGGLWMGEAWMESVLQWMPLSRIGSEARQLQTQASLGAGLMS